MSATPKIAGVVPPVNAGVMTARRYRFRLRPSPSMRAAFSACAERQLRENPMTVPVLSSAFAQFVLPSALSWSVTARVDALAGLLLGYDDNARLRKEHPADGVF